MNAVGSTVYNLGIAYDNTNGIWASVRTHSTCFVFQKGRSVSTGDYKHCAIQFTRVLLFVHGCINSCIFIWNGGKNIKKAGKTGKTEI
jgi:hypothetical protein